MTTGQLPSKGPRVSHTQTHTNQETPAMTPKETKEYELRMAEWRKGYQVGLEEGRKQMQQEFQDLLGIGDAIRIHEERKHP